MNDYEELFEQITLALESEKIPGKQAEFARKLFDAYVDQGFTEDQALELLKSEQPINVDASF